MSSHPKTVVSRRHLDKRISTLRRISWPETPRRGWIRAIRDSIGMTGAQLAKRLGVSQPTVTSMEQSEAERSITLNTLERAAHALGCRVVYALIPEVSLDKMVRARALELASKRAARVKQTMQLEDQAIGSDAAKRQLNGAVQQILEGKLRKLWSEE